MADPRDVLTRPAVEGVTFGYGDSPNQVVECFGPEDGPPIVFIHGGFWRHEYDRAHVRPLCNALAALGSRVFAIEYRRTGGAGGFPATFQDVLAALRAVGARTTGPVVLAGHSAGGHLALWAAAAPSGSTVEPADRATTSARSPIPLASVVALAPVSDLARAFHDDLDGGAVAALLGGSPDEFPQRYLAADPARSTGIDAPVTVIHGELDEWVPVDYSRRHVAEHGGNLVVLADIEHFGLIDPESSAWSWVYDAMRRR